MQRLWIPLVWITFALFDAVKTVGVMRSEGMHHNWPVLFVLEALSWLPWALATALIVRLARALRSLRPPFAIWSIHAVTAIAIDVVYAGWTTLLVMEFHPFGKPFPAAPLQHWMMNIYDNLPSAVVFYVCILMLTAFFESRERAATHEKELAQLNERLAQATLDALRRQIEPHFLFNALNAISGLVREGRTEAATTMIADLSGFLRRTLSQTSRHEVSLAEELEYVGQYLAVQKARFAGRLQLDVAVPAEVRTAAVPSLILQPLVENAIKHGVAKRREGGSLNISANASATTLHIRVENDGPGLRSDWHASKSAVGLHNVRSRLRALYGAESVFDIRTREGGGVAVTIALPLRVAAT